MQSWYGKDHPETADDMTILGKYLIAEGRADGAPQFSASRFRARESLRKSPSPRCVGSWRTGLALQHQGNLDEAEKISARQAVFTGRCMARKTSNWERQSRI